MAYGYNGRILHVDLTRSSWRVEEPSPVFYRTYWGGGLLAGRFLYDGLKRGLDPLGEENTLVFAASVLVGAPLAGFSRYTVCAVSPLTGAFGESEAGGWFGPELKFSGFDALVFRGKAPYPVYLHINAGRVELRDARHMWGMENAQLLDAVHRELGDKKIRVASIGPAGERLSPMACVISDLAHANGRCGMGAVMGSKNLKAVAVRGEPKTLDFADPVSLKQLRAVHQAAIKNHMPSLNMGKYGTPVHVMGLQGGGMLPTRNWREGVFEGAERLGVPGYEKILTSRGTCRHCSVACKRVVAVDASWDCDPRYGGPEYETLASFGSNCGIDDLPAVVKAHERCNAYGLDTISAGCTAAFAMECFERGILGPADAEGRSISFGDAEGMLWLIERMNDQQGIGRILAQGSQRAARIIGKGAEECVVAVKGMEPGLHDPRGKTGLAFSFAVSPTGADHIEIPHEPAFQGEAVRLIAPLGILTPPPLKGFPPEKMRYYKIAQDTWSMNNTLGICNFTVAPTFSLDYGHLVEAVQAITGWNTSLYELMAAGERALALARAANARLGFGRKDDRIPRRLCRPLPGGPNKGYIIDTQEFEQALTLYYRMNGFDDEGCPTEAKMHLMNLGDLLPVRKH